jgi:hypothetical protein
MLLSARPLDNVANVNIFTYVDVLRFTEGDVPTLYIQLVDLSQDRLGEGFKPTGRRYIPAITGTDPDFVAPTLEITISSIDDAKKIIRFATQPYSQDGSIWALTLFDTDKLRGTADMLLKLTEGTKVTRGVLRQALAVEPQIACRS